MSSLADQAFYVATGQAFDDEMNERIALHQQQRSQSGYAWETLEEPYDLPDLLKRLSGEKAVLVDCLTLWLSNVLLAMEGFTDRQELIESEITRLEDSVHTFQGNLILVTNEVGDGIVRSMRLADCTVIWQDV